MILVTHVFNYQARYNRTARCTRWSAIPKFRTASEDSNTDMLTSAGKKMRKIHSPGPKVITIVEWLRVLTVRWR